MNLAMLIAPFPRRSYHTLALLAVGSLPRASCFLDSCCFLYSGHSSPPMGFKVDLYLQISKRRIRHGVVSTKKRIIVG